MIEDLATQMGPQSQVVAERRLQEWADLGSPVAQRELALRYLAQPDKRKEAIALFERAASAGDAQAAVGLVGMARDAGDWNTASSTSASHTAGRVIDAAASRYAPR
ncbi:MAG: hypothetical protein ABW202_22230 [Duganella sp.]